MPPEVLFMLLAFHVVPVFVVEVLIPIIAGRYYLNRIEEK